jgi:hypothetical protein
VGRMPRFTRRKFIAAGLTLKRKLSCTGEFQVGDLAPDHEVGDKQCCREPVRLDLLAIGRHTGDGVAEIHPNICVHDQRPPLV